MSFMENNTAVPILVPITPEDFWAKMRDIVREEMRRMSGYVIETVRQVGSVRKNYKNVNQRNNLENS